MKAISLERIFARAEIHTLGLGATPAQVREVLGEARFSWGNRARSHWSYGSPDYGSMELGFVDGALARAVLDLEGERAAPYLFDPGELRLNDTGERCLEFLRARNIPYRMLAPRESLSGHFFTTEAGVRVYCRIHASLSPPSSRTSLAEDVLSASFGWMD